MLTRITEMENTLNVSIATVSDATGLRDDPISATATFFRVSTVDGSLAVEIGIGAVGVVTLAQQVAEVGFWGVGVDVADVIPGQFVVLFTVTFAAGESVAMDSFSRGENIDSTGTEVLTIAKALEILVAYAMGNAIYSLTTRRWTVYGRDGTTALAYITEDGDGNRSGSTVVG